MAQTLTLNQAEKQLLAYLHAVDGVGQRRLAWFLELKKKQGVNLLDAWRQEPILDQLLSAKNAKENFGRLKNRHDVVSYWRWLKDQDIRTLFLTDPDYPYLLKQTASPPTLLYLKYQDPKARALLKADLPIAVVGSRRMTAYGRYVTKKLTVELVALGATIVSGFMYGVDTQAHLATVEAGGGTVAVLGFGFGHMFPASHQKIFTKLLRAGGLFISQFAPHVRAHPGNFPARNAIVAGLSLGTLVTEAGIKSGSHITAQFALDEGRAVMAVPGPIDNPYSQGTKWLINEGATMVTSAYDVLNALDIKSLPQDPLVTNSQKRVKPEFKDELERKIYQLLTVQHLTTDELLKQLEDEDGLDLSRLSTKLTALELHGLIERVGVSWQGIRKC